MAPTARIRTRDCHIHVGSIFWVGDSNYPPPPAPPAMPNQLLKMDLASESERLAGAEGCSFFVVYMAWLASTLVGVEQVCGTTERSWDSHTLALSDIVVVSGWPVKKS